MYVNILKLGISRNKAADDLHVSEKCSQVKIIFLNGFRRVSFNSLVIY